MNNETDKYLDDLTKKVIKESSLETPSVDFTVSVMNQISGLNTTSITYKPLISKWGWTLIFVISVALVVFVMYDGGTSPSWLGTIDFSVLYDNKIISALSNFKMPKLFVYAMLLFGLMFSIQIPYLKYHFNKRFE